MNAERIRLIKPTLELEQAYRNYLQEFIEAGEESSLYHSREERTNLAACIRTLQDDVKNVAITGGSVPSSIYWLLSESGDLLGDIQIRHRLTPALEDFGGHIDYGVRPGQRRRGCATQMLALALEKAHAMGLKRVLITCDPANTGSVRTIQKNGGKLFSESIAKNGRLTSRYWIDLQPQEAAADPDNQRRSHSDRRAS